MGTRILGRGSTDRILRLLASIALLLALCACGLLDPALEPEPMPEYEASEYEASGFGAAPEHHLCGRCGGSGQITSSYEAPLPSRIDCELDRRSTGFLGLGEEQVDIRVTAYNDGDQGGTFTLNVRAGLPGQTYDQAVTLNETRRFIPPHESVSETFSYPISRLQNLVPVCRAVPPTVVQQRAGLCPVCNGSGSR